jgi:iron complex outermembrane receptor protein
MYKAKLVIALVAVLPVFFVGEAFAQLEEIIVTAQKRAENIQDAPIAITSISADTISEAGITDIADLTSIAPSLNFTQGSSGRNSSLRIRGLGTDSFNVGIEPSVSIVVDGVVQARPTAAFANLTDVSRIEVLRGPQGTLFGKNSSIGVISIITNSPNMEEFEGRVDLLAAQNSEYTGSVMLSGPLFSFGPFF